MSVKGRVVGAFEIELNPSEEKLDASSRIMSPATAPT
jgi:hypothetical protein